MAGAVVELIIFAVIAFVVIGKLISILGNTDESSQNDGFFGENTKMKNVTKSTKKNASAAKVIKPKFISKTSTELQKITVDGQIEDVYSGLTDVAKRMPNFNIQSFIKNAKSAFGMIIEAADDDNKDELEDLVDKRYLSQFTDIAKNYGGATSNTESVKALVSEVYMFGNNIFVKLLFSGNEITQNVKTLNEEWTFTKSILNKGPQWHLTNIDRLN